jgi:hypothetical protein
LLSATALALVAAPASAECEPDPFAPLEVTPAAGASGVTTDAWVMVRYGAGYFGPEGPGDDPASLVTLRRCGECDASCGPSSPTVPGHVEVLGDDLFFVPDAPLGERTRYAGEAVGLEGSLAFSFCTGDQADDGPPTFGQAVRHDSVEVPSSCELPDGGFRIGVYAEPATDDGPGGSLEYLLFLTRAEGLESPELVDRVRNFSAGEITMRLFLPRERAATPICLRMGVVDGVGNLTMAPDETCFDPVSQVSFQGCAAGHGPPGLGAPLLALLALSLAAARGPSRPAKRPRSSDS